MSPYRERQTMDARRSNAAKRRRVPPGGVALAGTRHQRGSAFFMALMALLVVTMVSLALITRTQLEAQMGGYERIGNRVLYAADSGVSVATARVLYNRDHEPSTFFLRETPRTAEEEAADRDVERFRIGMEVETARMATILRTPCNFCPVNQGGKQFFRVVHLANAHAQRGGWVGDQPLLGDDAVLQAERTVSATVEVMPWGDPPVTAVPTAEESGTFAF